MKRSELEGKHGVCKKVDELGRIVLPKEIREHLDVQPRERLEIIVEEDCVILKKHQESCLFCHEKAAKLHVFMEKHVCPACLERMLRELSTSENPDQ